MLHYRAVPFSSRALFLSGIQSQKSNHSNQTCVVDSCPCCYEQGCPAQRARPANAGACAPAGSTGHECHLCGGYFHGICIVEDPLGDSELKHLHKVLSLKCERGPAPRDGVASLVSREPSNTRDNSLATLFNQSIIAWWTTCWTSKRSKTGRSLIGMMTFLAWKVEKRRVLSKSSELPAIPPLNDGAYIRSKSGDLQQWARCNLPHRQGRVRVTLCEYISD